MDVPELSTALRLAIVAMIFGSTVAAFYTRLPTWDTWPWMRAGPIPFLTNVGGFGTGVFSIYLLVARCGWGKGAILWVAASIGSILIVQAFRRKFPLLLIVGLVCMYAGAIAAFIAGDL